MKEEYKLIEHSSSENTLELSKEEVNNESSQSSVCINIVESKHEQEQHIEPPKKKPRIYWADCLRIYSMFNIILLHCSSSNFERSLAQRSDPHVIFPCIYNCLSRFAVPVFVMLSGTFFLNPKKKFSLKRLIKRNITRLLTAYLFWDGVNSIVYSMGSPEVTTIFSLEFVKKFTILFLRGEEYLWFILMIIGCYICIPILRYFTGDKFALRYFLGLWLVWYCVVPMSIDILSMFNLEVIKSIFEVWVERIHFHMTLDYLGYFVAGYYIFEYVNIESIKYRIIVYIIGFIDVLAIIIPSIVYELINKDLYYYLRSRYYSITIIIYSVTLVIFFKHEIGRIKFSERAGKIITKMSSYTFGIYLSHMLIRNILVLKCNLNADRLGKNIHYSPLFGIPILVLITSGISITICLVISYIPILNKYVM